MELLGKMVVALFTVVFTTTLTGIGLQTLWAWFIVPLGTPNISIAHAIGIALFVGFFKDIPNEIDKNSGFATKTLYSVFVVVIKLSIFLVLGVIVHGLMP